MTKANVTFIGGGDAGDVQENEWGTRATGVIKFPLNEPVLLDTEAAGADQTFVENLIRKARKNPHFRVEDVADDGGNSAATRAPAPVRHPQGSAPRAPVETNRHRGEQREAGMARAHDTAPPAPPKPKNAA